MFRIFGSGKVPATRNHCTRNVIFSRGIGKTMINMVHDAHFWITIQMHKTTNVHGNEKI